MDTVTAMILVPLLVWAGVFVFLLSVDRRVRALERRIEERRGQTPEPAAPPRTIRRSAPPDKETLAR